MTAIKKKVLASIVTFNNQATVLGCIGAICNQRGFNLGENLEVFVTDNCSSDTTQDLLHQSEARIHKILNSNNLGFCLAHNRVAEKLQQFEADYLLLLNPDLKLEPEVLSILVDNLEQDPTAGTATPKLRRADPSLEPTSVLDSCGIYLRPSFRHLDRGAGQEDQGQFDQQGYVFGGTGAALLIKASAIEELKRSWGFFLDERFFAYREDADLAFRLQFLGWKCRYLPKAIGWHVRRVTPERRKDLPPFINKLGVKNRFLLQLNSLSLGMGFRVWTQTWLRNFLVMTAVMLREKNSRPAFKELRELFPAAIKLRRRAKQHRRITSSQLKAWFYRDHQSYLMPAEEISAAHPIAKKIHIVIVEYLSGERLLRCLESVGKSLVSEDREILISVCCNSPCLLLPNNLAERIPCLEMLDWNHNIGFGPAINRAFKRRASDILIILNPDLEVFGTTIETLVSELDRYPQLTAIAPLFFSEKQVLQQGFAAKNLPTLSSTVVEQFFLHRLWPNNPWTKPIAVDRSLEFETYAKGEAAKGIPHHELTIPYLVEQPPAACFAIRSGAFESLGGFDEEFYPAWFEDVDLCDRLKRRGQLVAVTNKTKVQHEGGYSRTISGDKRFLRIWYRNLIRYWQARTNLLEKTIFFSSIAFGFSVRSILRLIASERR